MLNKLPFFKGWTTIEVVELQSPYTLQKDPLIIEIQVKGEKTFRKKVVRQVFDDTASEEDKAYYLTQYLLVVEYIDAVNKGEVKMPCKEFLKLANMIYDIKDADDVPIDS